MASPHARSIFIIGLQNAHAMERQAQQLLERQCERLTRYPQVCARIGQHLEETGRQLRRLEECLGSMNQDRSRLKDAGMALLGNVLAGSHALAGDEIIKSSFADYAFEHYEIAAYKSLLVLAEQLGSPEAQASLRQSLDEEEKMAAWILDHLRDLTLEYLRREEIEMAR
ncbi:MAG TPA: ferritin-like domain-containing protein [Xanthobacteraceae bacterium]